MKEKKIILYLTIAVKDKTTHEWSIKKEKIEVDSYYNIKDYLTICCGYDIYEAITILDKCELKIYE